MMHGLGLSPAALWLFGAAVICTLGIFVSSWFRRRLSQPPEGETSRPRSRKTETDVYRLARKFNGRLTVSDVVIHLDFAPREAEKILENMTDGVRVRMEVSDRGLITFEFTELTGSPLNTSNQSEHRPQ